MPAPAEHTEQAPPRRAPHRDPRRIYVVAAVLLIGLVVVAVRLIKLQVIDGDQYATIARRQYESRVTLQAERGTLFDRNGNLLATNSTSYSFAVDPTHVEHPRTLAAAFQRALGGEQRDWLEKLTRDNTSFVWLQRKVTGLAATALKDLDDNGLIIIKEPLRHFEYASLGSQAIGCTDIDNNGLSGVELFYNQQLRGADGFMVMQRDSRGRRRPDADLPLAKPEHGDGLVLTLDINMQGIVEDELRKGVERAGAASGTAIALDPRTGEILSIASWPSYDPNNPSVAEQSMIRVRAITDTYEPGSTMKIITAAAALEEEAVTLQDSINAEGGEYQLGNHTIRDDHPMAVTSFRTAFQESSNIVFAKVAARLPAPRFYKYVRDFGFGIISGIDLPGEARGEVKKPNEFSQGTQEFMAFGYQLAVTPLQLVTACAAIANGGVMMKPHLLKRRISKDQEIIEEVIPQEIRQVVSRQTADSVRALMEGVVQHGTGKEARVDGLRVAGKTGTAQQLANGSYSKEKYNASFVGFFPADDPQVALLVLLDSPTNGYYGGQVAAPIFREIARRIMGVGATPAEPQFQMAASDTIAARYVAAAMLHAPELRGIEADAAGEIARKLGFRVVRRGAGNIVMAQSPMPGLQLERHGILALETDTWQSTGGLPNLQGLPLRRALNILNACRAKPKVVGTGIVQTQYPPPGTPIRASMEVRIEGRR